MLIVGSEKQGEEVDSLGIKLKRSSYEMATKKSIFIILTKYIENNPALAMAVILNILIFLYLMALFEKLTLFNYIGVIASIFFMFWVSLSDDARTGFKLISIGVIFMVVVIFISL